MVRKVVAVAIVAATLMVSACNTVAGAGKDVSSAGDAVTNAAK
ncbi:putative small secreted protein [Sphingomonas vulcanisoli]|uniref:Small secreted protein n=1 Tax=Sphingomonas vulcanisoli TaxID=1658060 RepID=A0ABX0TU01_9SPHN|nr:entericidin A/B family lipoprotein [Sphingomonas vulcanisoli]NIJ07639.1 putative small secreted protein [Sphingomonas vulcanisoli]